MLRGYSLNSCLISRTFSLAVPVDDGDNGDNKSDHGDEGSFCLRGKSLTGMEAGQCKRKCLNEHI